MGINFSASSIITAYPSHGRTFVHVRKRSDKALAPGGTTRTPGWGSTAFVPVHLEETTASYTMSKPSSESTHVNQDARRAVFAVDPEYSSDAARSLKALT